jgi:SAM-dependent methyltransferase
MDVLTEAEFASYRPHPMMVDYLERCRARFGVDKTDFRVLDWGCGRGRLVLWLRERGYDAAGVDIDPTTIARGGDLFKQRGHDVESCLHLLDTAGRAPLADSSFHCVISWQTLEHVADLDAVVAEWRRLTMDGGGGFHIYPPHHRLDEGHLFMPLVHWLPKNATRKWLIGVFVLLRIEPHWWPAGKVRWAEKVRTYYRYSVDETFYRNPDVVRRCLAAGGLEAEFVDVAGWRPGRKFVQRWLGLDSSSWIIRTWYMNYGGTLGLATTLRTSMSRRDRLEDLPTR